jgi:hypothetical protein
MSEPAFAGHAAFLISLAEPDQACTTFYDEDDETVHEWEDGVLTISTDFTDYTSYKLTPVAGSSPLQFDVVVENEDGVAELDADAQADLAERLARLVEQARQFQDKRELTGEEQKVLDALLLPAGQWEWKEWPEIGTSELQQAIAAQQLDIEITAPSAEQQRRVYASDDFTSGVLEWFREQLHPQGWTLAAVSPFDELQEFFLVRNARLDQARYLLGQQGRRLK